MRRLLAHLALGLALGWAQAAAATTIILTSGTTWTVPADWNNSANSVECIGAGGNGGTPSAVGTNATGGGGGLRSS